MSGLGLGLGLIRRRRTSAAATLWDYDLTTGSLPPVLSVSRATSGSRIASSGLIEILGANAARFDFDPISHACRGLLVEPQLTYAGIDSEAHSSAAWLVSSGLVRTDMTADSPLRTGDTVTRCGQGTQAYSSIIPASGANASGKVTQAWLLRNVDSQNGRIVLRDNTLSVQVNVVLGWSSFTLGATLTSMTPSAPASGLSVDNYGFFDLGGGWWTAWGSFTHPAGDSINSCRLDPSQFPNGLSLDVAATWVALSPLTYCPSYIPTTGSSVTRDADVPVVSDVSRAYRITYTPLTGGAAQTQDVAIGQQPPALPGRWTRIQQL